MKSSDSVTSIGVVAERFGLATHVLRHWESIGLLRPARDSAGRRRYGEDDAFRIAVILRAKEAGFALDDIQAMLSTTDSAARSAVLRNRRSELQARVAKAQASLEMIDHALACDHEDFTSCPHFRGAVSQHLLRPRSEGRRRHRGATGPR
ncbi:MerR family transcriptional regulator [Nocardia sp. KC 131]|uniref:MerR family transcriptional regulator n=1 Tax=Nocardia arseniciresistens TaxID=3392119 RepID=UPI00398EB594